MRFADYMAEEIARLEAELEASPTYKLLQALKAAAAVAPAVYGPPAPVQPAEPADIEATAQTDEPKRSPSGRRLNPARQQALEVISEVLAGRAEPIKTATLMEFIVGRGIELGGNEPQNNLSALLHTSGQFTSHGRRGWTLKREGAEEEEQQEDGGDPEGSSSAEPAERDDEVSAPEAHDEPTESSAPRHRYPWEAAPP